MYEKNDSLVEKVLLFVLCLSLIALRTLVNEVNGREEKKNYLTPRYDASHLRDPDRGISDTIYADKSVLLRQAQPVVSDAPKPLWRRCELTE